MTGYREIRTISGKKIWTRETRQEHADRLILRAEIILAPLIAIFVFAVAAGMIKLG
ncbi:MAG: hypothetical protein IIY28_07400 [Lachnospiraceae bacterium]|nr:hypothetical protein [Lachnospiraceae bacterium]